MEQVSNTLQRIMAEALKRLPPEQLPQAAWDFAAGRAVAEKTRVIAWETQTLLVEVPDANWRAQLNAMAPQFLARLNPFIPVERIEFKLARSQDSAPATGTASVAAYPAAKLPRRKRIV
jgi:predicted nucleic acid-binding Zn ribbon protein